MSINKKIRLQFVLVILLAIFSSLIAFPNAVRSIPQFFDFLNKPQINLGLDLQGGLRLEYKADLLGVDKDKQGEALQAAQDVIERRVNAFGVGEPLVQTAFSGGEHRITVELPGIEDIEEAKNMIKETPFLEFKEEKTEGELLEDTREIEQILAPINEQSKSTAKEVLKRAILGEDFSELAKEFSKDPGSRDKGGDLGFVKKRDSSA